MRGANHCAYVQRMSSSDWLLQLFTTELAEVRFPEIDAASLSAHHLAVDEATLALEEAEQALARASATLADRKLALSQHSKRALAYVKIYAEERPELREQLESLLSTRKGAAEPSEPKKRGRPRKEPTVSPLFEPATNSVPALS